MKRGIELHRLQFIGFVATALLASTSVALAVPVNLAPVDLRVNGPPYPTAPLTADLVIVESGATVIIDRYSSSIASLNPIGAVDHTVVRMFGAGVEREMKESGEKGGTKDINISAGELQECTISKSMDRASSKLAQFAINGNSLSLVFEFTSAMGSVEFHSVYTTPQPAVFTDVSVLPASNGSAFDLKFSLLYSDRYNPALSIVNEVMTADFVAIPEPNAVILFGLGVLGLSCCAARHR